MLCKIADLITEIPEVGDLVPRCKEYVYEGSDSADIIIRTDQFQYDFWSNSLTENQKIYLESGIAFTAGLNKYDGMMLHSSAITLDGRAYLFSGPSGIGKSTHSKLWQKSFGERVLVINDDKPVIRKVNNIWYVYGTPWCGKDGINKNQKAPLAGICFLRQSQKNQIRRLSQFESAYRVREQSRYVFMKKEDLDISLSLLNRLVKEIPVYELENKPEVAAAHLSYETMRRGAEEIGL